MKYILDKCNIENLNKEISLNAWVKKIRKMGSMIFMDVYDTSGFVQVIVNEANKFFSEIEKTPKESVVAIKGILVERKSKNDKIATGNFEIKLTNFNVYSNAETPPFLIQDETDALEDTRLKYRYLDLRRPCLQSNIKFRSKFLYEIRTFLQKNNFIEIETPYLSKQTPEGARDYLVPTRTGNFFALPQSPQIFKQLLMVSGFMKYYQIVRCFRDEDLRADRQPEFTQLDMEISFSNEEVIYKYIEAMIRYVLKKTLDIKTPEKFERMTYATAMDKFGSDKPDLRYDYEIFNLSEIVCSKNLDKIDSRKPTKAIIFNEIKIKESEYETLNKYAKDNKASNINWITFDKGLILNKEMSQYFSNEEIKSLFNQHNYENGTLVFINDDLEICQKSLGAIRNAVINLYKPEPKEKFKFVWIVDWPLYEYSKEDNKYKSAHHPFTSPAISSIKDFDTNKKEAKARSYDLVLNGYEIGGGSIRIHDSELQRRVFLSLGLTNEEIDKKFWFMINAFKYGVPPHGGIALGIERMLMILLGSETIRDVIAFPKNSSGYDIMQESPCEIEDELLKELKLSKINE